MIRTLMLTGYDEKFAPIGELTVPLMEDYAARLGFDFKCQRNYPTRYPAYWQKLVDVVEAFAAGYDQVFWLDADQMITNRTKVPHYRQGFFVSKDWGMDATEPSHFSMCGFTATPNTLPLFEYCLEREDHYAHGYFPDQKPMRDQYENNRDLIHVLPSRVFNAVPIEVHESVRDPWRPGDFACHLTMLEVEQRVELFHEIAKRL